MKHDDNQQQREEEIQRLYRLNAKEAPGQSLDKAILTLAHESVARKKSLPQQQHGSFWRRYRWPLSSAASVLVVATLYLLNPELQPTEVLDDMQPMMMESAPTRPEPLTSSQNDVVNSTANGGLSHKQLGAAPAAVMQQAEISHDKTESLSQVEPELLSLALIRLTELIDGKKLTLARQQAEFIREHYPEVELESHPHYPQYIEQIERLNGARQP